MGHRHHVDVPAGGSLHFINTPPKSLVVLAVQPKCYQRVLLAASPCRVLSERVLLHNNAAGFRKRSFEEHADGLKRIQDTQGTSPLPDGEDLPAGAAGE